MSKRILGWDIGIKNLAYCVLDYEADGADTVAELVAWEVIDIDPQNKNIGDLHRKLTAALNARSELWGSGISTVVIENQPTPNIKMKTIAAALFQYMVMSIASADIRYSYAKHKMKAYDGPELVCDRKTKQDKWFAVQHVKWFLAALPADNRWVVLFNSTAKKDDLADSLLHCIVNIKKGKLTLRCATP
jgi:hypothetical protein